MIEVLCGCSRGHISCSINLKFSQKVCLDKVLYEIEFGSVVRIKEIPCGPSTGHISCSVDLKIGQNVCLDEISDEYDLGGHWGHKIGH